MDKNEKSNQPQVKANSTSTVECTKCHQKVSADDGIQKASGFVCNECLKKAKKRKIAIISVIALLVVSGILSWLFLGKQARTGQGFEGVGAISDSMNVTVNSSAASINIASATAASSSVSTQKPVSNLQDFQHEISKNISEAAKTKNGKLIFPSIRPLFEINTNFFSNNSDEIVKAFASNYLKTNKKAKLLVQGYTCDLGSFDLNDKLSRTRANAVKQLLIASGVPEGQIDTKWYGKSHFKDFHFKDKEQYRCVIVSIK